MNLPVHSTLYFGFKWRGKQAEIRNNGGPLAGKSQKVFLGAILFCLGSVIIYHVTTPPPAFCEAR